MPPQSLFLLLFSCSSCFLLLTSCVLPKRHLLLSAVLADPGKVGGVFLACPGRGNDSSVVCRDGGS